MTASNQQSSFPLQVLDPGFSEKVSHHDLSGGSFRSESTKEKLREENSAEMDQNIPTTADAANETVFENTDSKNVVENSQSENKPTKVIGFVLNDKRGILEDVFEYPACPREEQQYTDEELDEILTEAMLVAEEYTEHQKIWQNKIKMLFKGCRTRDINTNEKPAPLKGEDLDFVVDCEARGLELYIHPMFRKSRVKAVKSVIKIQQDYNASEEKKGKKDPELRLKVLRNQSLKYTQPARLMAKTLACGDARAAKRALQGMSDLLPDITIEALRTESPTADDTSNQ